MIDRHRGHDRDVGIDDIDGVEPASQADFEHHHVQRGAREQTQRGERAELEVGERRRQADGFHCGKRFEQGLVGCLGAVDAHPLVVAQKVRRGIGPDPIAAGTQHALEQRAG